MSRGFENNNPGNIRKGASKFLGEKAVSTDPAFRQFETMELGYRAIFKLLHNYIDKGFDTISKMINRWAPSNENNTTAYINYIVKRTGINANQLISKGDKERLIKIVEALADYENSGNAPDIKQVTAGWDLLKFNTWSQKKKSLQ